MGSTPVSARISTASSLQPALVSASTTLRAVLRSSNNPMTEVGMAHSSVMFSNQNGRAPISTHPARAHKHAAAQTVPKKHQAAIEKCRAKNQFQAFAHHVDVTILYGSMILSKCGTTDSAKVRF